MIRELLHFLRTTFLLALIAKDFEVFVFQEREIDWYSINNKLRLTGRVYSRRVSHSLFLIQLLVQMRQTDVFDRSVPLS